MPAVSELVTRSFPIRFSGPLYVHEMRPAPHTVTFDIAKKVTIGTSGDVEPDDCLADRLG